MKDNSFSFSGGTISELVEEKKTSGAGGWPIIAEETCFVFLEDILKGLAFLRGIGLVHGDIKGILFARNHLRLEMIISLQILFLFIGSHLCRHQISLAVRAMPGRSAQPTKVFKNYKQLRSCLRKLTCYIQTILKSNWFERLVDQKA